MDEQKTESIETSIEDIVEEISAAESSDTSSSKLKINELKNIKRKLFAFDNDEEEHIQSPQNDSKEEQVQLHQNDSKEEQIQSHQKGIEESANVNNTESKKIENDSNISKETAGEEVKEKKDEQSTKNQSMKNYTSDIIDEESGNTRKQQLKSASFELAQNDSSISIEKPKYHSLDSALKEIDQQQSPLVEKSVHSDHSVKNNLDEKKLPDSNVKNDDATQNKQTLIISLLPAKNVDESVDEEPSLDTEEDDMNMFKEKVLLVNNNSKENDNTMPFKDIMPFEQREDQKLSSKKMEKVQEDFEKEILEDITEESEKISIPNTTGVTNDTTNDFDSIVSLNMIQMLEDRAEELSNLVFPKDTSLNSLNAQLDASQRRELFAHKGDNDSLKDIPPSGRESTSLATTTSTEYRTIQEEYGNKILDIHLEISQKNNVIERLTESLQQSMKIREQLQQQSDQLSLEVQQLRKQLTETLDSVRKPYWPRDQESTGQRLSEISIDLVSESDEDLDRQILTDEERISNSTRNSKERQLIEGVIEIYDPEIPPITKQIEQFQKYLNPDELRIFFMVQKKFDDLLSQEIEKVKVKFENEIKVLNEQFETEKHDKDLEVNRLRQLLSNVKSGSTELVELRQELETIHSHEMEKLRMYFERKCADLEKQYSEDIFSQKSARDDSINSCSDLSEPENLPEENQKEGSPRKKTKKELYASPSHRQITVGVDIDSAQDQDIEVTIGDLKMFYQEKIQDIRKNYEAIIGRQNERIKYYEAHLTEDDFMKNSLAHHPLKTEDGLCQGTVSPSYIIIDEDEAINESQEIRTIAAEYERRLQEQIALAKEDILHELENQIQALLSETTTDDKHWPSELILLREKFTAKNQLEIAQLKIKHEEEMSRLKSDYEKRLNRKIKRNSNFDLSRDLDQIVNEKENLRELSSTFRWILYELAKCVTLCEKDFNSTFMNELNNLASPEKNDECDEYQSNHNMTLNSSGQSQQSLQMNNTTIVSTTSKQLKFAPDVSGLLSLIDDPKLVEFVTNENDETISSFNLKECLEKLKIEANHLLKLSENLNKRYEEIEESDEKNDSCEEEDGLKRGNKCSPKKVTRTSSFNENILRHHSQDSDNYSLHGRQIVFSLPPNLQNYQQTSISSQQAPIDGDLSLLCSTGEIHLQVHELKNRLVKSENDRQKLQRELEMTITRNTELGQELNTLKEQLEQLDSHKEEYNEGYTLGQIKSPHRIRTGNSVNSFSQLQERARNFLSTPIKNMNDNSQLLLQMIEEFCREGDRVVDDSKKEREDLQSQIEAADKQLKSIRQFLDDQAAERELERDEFLKEIDRLKTVIKDKDKERTSFEVASKEIEQMEHQIKDLNQQLKEVGNKKDKLEIELKASIDKIFVLREIISELENQVETKSLNEHVLSEKVKELEMFIASQTRSNEKLQNQVESLKTEIGQGYQEKIAALEDQLRNSRSNAEQIGLWNQIVEQLRDVETTLEHKTKTLESLHHSVCSVSCSTSPIEDVSVQDQIKRNTAVISPQGSPANTSSRSSSLPVDQVQRIIEKLGKHTRVEEAAIKRIKDLEMQIANIRTSFTELQHERDVLQEKMSEQLQRISVLQAKLDEQRHHAEELQRHGKSDLTIRIHDLQNEVRSLTETLSVRDKQILNLKKQLEQSKLIIERQEAELAADIQSDRSSMEKLKAELEAKTNENKRLKEKMKTEMINKLALPDLMETMLADKNEEIDHLKEQLASKEKKFQEILEINLNQQSNNNKEKSNANGEDEVEASKSSARTLSDIHSISEYDEPQVVRRAPLEERSPLILPDVPQNAEQTMESSKQIHLNVSQPASKVDRKTSSCDSPHYFHQQTPIIRDETGDNSLIPRRINFSELENDSQAKDSTPKLEEIAEDDEIKLLNAKLTDAEKKIEELKASKETTENEKNTEIERMKLDFEKKYKIYETLKEERDQLLVKIQESKAKLENYLKLESDLNEEKGKVLELQNQLSEAKQALEKIEIEIRNKDSELSALKQRNEELNQLNRDLEDKIALTISNSDEKIKSLENQINILKDDIDEKNKILSKQEKNLFNWQQNEKNLLEKISKLELEIQTIKMSNTDALKYELDLVKTELSEKILLYEKCLLDIQAHHKEIEMFKSQIKEKEMIINSLSNGSKSLQNIIAATQQRLDNNESVNEIKNKLHDEKQRNLELEKRNATLELELEKLRSQSSDSSKPFSVDEIAEQVEKELNYSAQLDSNILKVINNEKGNNLDLKTDHEKLIERDLLNQIQSLKNELETERRQMTKIAQELNEEKRQSQGIQQQDAEIIQALRIRLEDALHKEEEFHKILEEERAKCERLSTQITVLQRSEARKASMQLKSPPDSPRKAIKDFDLELSERLKTEIKLLTAQNERERERVTDLQRVLEREKVRFETELSDRINYADKLKKEMEKIAHEKELAESHAEHLEERLSLASQEIESLEARITALQEAETRRAHRRGKERLENTQNAVEVQELKTKVINLEAERNQLAQTVATLRSDIEKSAQREGKLVEALANSCGDAAVPEQFMQKLKEINYMLVENTKENRQMTETIRYLTDERKILQKKIEELEMINQSGTTMAANLMEMEERANHLFGRYLRVESHRKALVHQKRYLLIVLQTYQENEMKTLQLLNVNVPKKSKKKLFKSVALVIVAIQRMKFIVRRWQTGKRIVSKSIFHIQSQKRSTLPINFRQAIPTSNSPPCRDKTSFNNQINYMGNHLEPLHAPSLITDYSEKKLFGHHTRND